MKSISFATQNLRNLTTSLVPAPSATRDFFYPAFRNSSRTFAVAKVRLAKIAQYIAIFRLYSRRSTGGFAGAQPRLAKIAQYIAIFRLKPSLPIYSQYSPINEKLSGGFQRAPTDAEL